MTDTSRNETFHAGASFRVEGANLDMEGISRELGQKPTHIHRCGAPDILKHPYLLDAWHLSSPFGRDQDLEVHLSWLANHLLPHKQYICTLQKTSKVDIYCHKTCYTEQSALILSPPALRIFTELGIDLQVSLIYLPDDSEDTSSSITHP